MTVAKARPGHACAGPTARIASVEAFVLLGEKTTSWARRPRRALAKVGDLHICAYPPRGFVKLGSFGGADIGIVGKEDHWRP
jgi:hypothetical protein